VTEPPPSVLIPIDEVNFGAAKFCEILAEKFDLDGDGQLSEEEMAYPNTETIGTIFAWKYSLEFGTNRCAF